MSLRSDKFAGVDELALGDEAFEFAGGNEGPASFVAGVI
jgi:hypothetical protein